MPPTPPVGEHGPARMVITTPDIELKGWVRPVARTLIKDRQHRNPNSASCKHVLNGKEDARAVPMQSLMYKCAPTASPCCNRKH